LPRLAPKSLHLSETERKELQQLVNRYSTSQQIATRARIILLADDGQNHRQIARSWTSAEIWLALGVTDGWSCKSESCHHLKDCRMQSAVEHQRL